MNVPIDSIKTKDRIREDLGNIDALKESMQLYGLIQPITLNSRYELLSGYRRLTAAKELHWHYIPAYILSTADHLEELNIELIENTMRKSFNSDEIQKGMKEKEKLSNKNIFFILWLKISSFFKKLFHLKMLVLLSLFFFGLSENGFSFSLEKTVNLDFLEGTIEVKDSNTIIGKMEYVLSNSQDQAIDNLYFVMNSNIRILKIQSRKKEDLKFVEDIRYSFKVINIKIPELDSNKRTTLDIYFSLKPPASDLSQVFSKDSIFLTMNDRWIPLPQSTNPSFFYSLNIITPKNTHAVLGAKIVKEKNLKNNQIYQNWKSEIKNPYATANLYVSNLPREKEKETYFYSSDFTNKKNIFNYSHLAFNFLKSEFDFFPLSEVHIVNDLDFSLTGAIDHITIPEAIFFANTVFTSKKSLATTDLMSIAEILNSPIPYIPTYSEFRLLENITHEISHAISPGVIAFDQENSTEVESLTEFIALEAILSKYPDAYDKFLLRNHMVLANLYVNAQNNSRTWSMIYGVNVLAAAFPSSDSFISFINYLYKTNPLFSQADFIDYAITFNSNLDKDEKIQTDAFSLWNSNKLYNIKLESSNMKKNYKHLTLKNTFPINVPGTLYMSTKEDKSLLKNDINIPKNGETSVIIDPRITKVEFKSNYEYLESHLGDNILEFDSSFLKDLESMLNGFYLTGIYQSNEKFSINENFVPEQEWQNIKKNQLTHKNYKGYTVFDLDKLYENDEKFYITAYKYINNQVVNYVLFSGNKKDGMYILDSILDAKHEETKK